MILYAKNGKQIEINDNYQTNGISYGCCGEIYHYNTEKCVKIYYDSCIDSAKLNKDMYERLQNIKSDYFIKIYDLLYNDSSLEQIRGYMMKYYEEKKLKILEKRTEYTLHILENFKKLFDEFIQNNIVVDDVKRENTIYDGDKIIVIDPDLFYFESKQCFQEKEYFQKYNYRQLISLLENIYLEEVKQLLTLDYRKNPFSVLNELFDMDNYDNMVDNLSKKLKKYKYPKEYFSKRI